MEKSTALKVDGFLALLIFISFFTTDWDYLNSDDGSGILTIVYIGYAIIIGIGVYVTYLGYSVDSGEGKPPTMDAYEIKALRLKSSIFIVIGIIIGAYVSAFLEPGSGTGLLLLAVVFGVIGVIMGFQAKGQESRLVASKE